MSCDNCSAVHDYYSENIYTWCTNCGNYGIAAAVKRALVAENIKPHQALLCYDIGCNGNGADKTSAYSFHGLHGRALPFAAGAAVSNRKLKVVASAGDGATLSEGINHLVSCVRHNFDFTFILHNNGNYALTTGQASATTRQGQPMNGSPEGVDVPPINVAEFVMGLGATFVARAFSGNVHQMTEIFREAMKHPGFGFVEVLQSCPTFNHATPHEWFLEHTYDTVTNPNFDNTNLEMAKQVAADMNEHIATGILYRNPNAVDFYQTQGSRHNRNTELVEEVTPGSIEAICKHYR